MKIGLISSQQIVIDRFFSDWVGAWLAEGDEVHIALESGQTSQLQATSLTQIPGLSRRPSLGFAKARAAIASWADRRQLDVVVTNAATPSAMVRLAPLTVPTVYFCHGLHWRDSKDVPSYWWSLPERFFLRNTDGIVCMNDADEAWFRERYSGPILRLASGVGLSVDTWRRSPQTIQHDPLRLLWIAEFSQRKRPQDALAIHRQLISRGIPSDLVMLGQGKLYEKLCRKVSKQDNVILPGHVDPIPYLQQASLLLHTAEWEGLARVLLEGIAMGVPTFGYFTKGVADVPGVITAGRPGDTAALADAIAQWLSRGQARPDVGADQFNWKTSFDRFASFLALLVQE